MSAGNDVYCGVGIRLGLAVGLADSIGLVLGGVVGDGVIGLALGALKVGAADGVLEVGPRVGVWVAVVGLQLPGTGIGGHTHSAVGVDVNVAAGSEVGARVLGLALGR